MCEPCDTGTEHQRILVDGTENNIVTGSGEFIITQTNNGCNILGVQWKKGKSNEYEHAIRASY
eukprot:10165354-Ditylum_brightwellii.AAC.1